MTASSRNTGRLRLRRRTAHAGDPAARAFLRFHFRVGVRVGLRLSAPVLAALFAAYYLLRPELVLLFADHLLARGSGFSRGAKMTLVLLPLAVAVTGKIGLGLSGWVRHLPESSARQRRLAALSAWIAESPVLVILAAFGFLSCGKNALGTGVWTAAAIGLSAFAVSLSVLPLRKPAWAAALGLGAGVLCGSGNWPAMAAGLALLWTADAFSGPFISRRAFGLRRRSGGSPLAFFSLLHWRALGWRILLPALPAAAIFRSIALFLRNNPFPPGAAAAAGRFGGAAAVGSFLTLLVVLSSKRRPPWAWFRSAPLSARRRAFIDALFLGAHASPLLVPAALLWPRSVPAVFVYLGFMSLRAAAALRQAPEAARGPFLPFLLESVGAAALLALWPASAFLFAAGTAPALWAAERRERAMRVGRWRELRYSAAGDALNGSLS